MKEMIIFNVEVGDMPQDQLCNYMYELRKYIEPKLKELKCEYIFVPTFHGKGRISLADPNSTVCFCIDGKYDKNIEITSEQLLSAIK